MRVINVYEAKTHLSQLLAAVAAGEEIVIARAGKPLAKLVPYQEAVEPRTPGYRRGRVGSPRISMTCQRPSRPLSGERPCDLAVGYGCAAVWLGMIQPSPRWPALLSVQRGRWSL